MKALDGRHRWEFQGRDGIYLVHKCRACGKVEKFETLIPDAIVSAIVANFNRPNPYRDMFR